MRLFNQDTDNEKTPLCELVKPQDSNEEAKNLPEGIMMSAMHVKALDLYKDLLPGGNMRTQVTKH